jgi:hypothetical protein
MKVFGKNYASRLKQGGCDYFPGWKQPKTTKINICAVGISRGLGAFGHWG